MALFSRKAPGVTSQHKVTKPSMSTPLILYSFSAPHIFCADLYRITYSGIEIGFCSLLYLL